MRLQFSLIFSDRSDDHFDLLLVNTIKNSAGKRCNVNLRGHMFCRPQLFEFQLKNAPPPKFDSKTPYGPSKPIIYIDIATLGGGEKIEFQDSWFTLFCLVIKVAQLKSPFSFFLGWLTAFHTLM